MKVLKKACQDRKFGEFFTIKLLFNSRFILFKRQNLILKRDSPVLPLLKSNLR